MGSTDKKIKSSSKDKKVKSSSKDKKVKHSSKDKSVKSSSKDKKKESASKEKEEEEAVESATEEKEAETPAEKEEEEEEEKEKEEKKDEDSSKEIEKALKDPTKKRKAEDEIEIDLESSIPLSKKQKRLLRRGKLTLKELNDKYNIDPASIDQYKKEQKGKDGEGETGEDGEKKEKTKSFSVWVGNLSFDTTSEEITKFIVGKTKDLEDEESRITEDDIVRIKLPLANNDGKQVKNKGFCYIDFKTEAQMKSCVKLSENQLNGRNLLIKDSKNFEGRPDKNDLVSASKNPPSRILFVGNLSYTTTDELLRSHFQHCGEIVKVRMATFEDSGKCKGFAFIDFKDETGATKALTDKSLRKLALRPIRMEYGEDRSKRQVRRRPEQSNDNKKQFDLPSNNYGGQNSGYNSHEGASSHGYNSREGNTRDYPPRRDESRSFSEDRPPSRKPRTNNRNFASNNRVKSSIALSSAQRGSAAIVPSQGKKMKFD